MAFTHAWGAYSVEGSLNEWFRVNLTAAGVPAWMPSARVVFDYAEQPLIQGHSGATFALTHLGAPEVIEQYQGKNVGGTTAGAMVGNLLRVDCWISKQQAGGAYAARVRQMGDMVSYLFTSAHSVQITNVYTATQAPSAIGSLIHFGDIRDAGTVNPDPNNPDLFRRGFVIPYRWVEKVSR